MERLRPGVVENGTASQYASLESLEYIKQTGRCVTVGTAETAGEDPGVEGETAPVCTVRWADPTPGKSFFALPIQRFMEVILKKSRRSCFLKRR